METSKREDLQKILQRKLNEHRREKQINLCESEQSTENVRDGSGYAPGHDSKCNNIYNGSGECERKGGRRRTNKAKKKRNEMLRK